MSWAGTGRTGSVSGQIPYAGSLRLSSRLMPHVTWARGSLELHNLSKKLAPSQGINSTLQTPNLQTINFCVLLVLCFSHFSRVRMKLSSWISLYKVIGKRSNIYFYLLQIFTVCRTYFLEPKNQPTKTSLRWTGAASDIICSHYHHQ